jgi:hypothetical protein
MGRPIQSELDSGELFYLSDMSLDEAGYYLLYKEQAAERSDSVKVFVNWINNQ